MLQNHRLSKAIGDVSWNKFIKMIQYKALWNDRIYYKIGRYYASSQICNNCGYKNIETKDLGVREWVCPNCNIKHNRDINAAINIKKQGLKELGLIV